MLLYSKHNAARLYSNKKARQIIALLYNIFGSYFLVSSKFETYTNLKKLFFSVSFPSGFLIRFDTPKLYLASKNKPFSNVYSAPTKGAKFKVLTSFFTSSVVLVDSENDSPKADPDNVALASTFAEVTIPTLRPNPKAKLSVA